MLPDLDLIYRGDALDIMRTWPDNFVQTVITSPPYWGLRDYGVKGQLGLEGTPAEYVRKIVTVFKEVKRLLRRDGTVWLNLGDSYSNETVGQRLGGTLSHWKDGGRRKPDVNEPLTLRRSGLPKKNLVGIPWRVALALQADGWILRSDIIWSKSNPMPESVTDRPTKSHEYIFLLTKSSRYYYNAEAIKEPSVSTPVMPWAERKAEGELIRHGGSQNAPALNRKKKPSGWHNNQGNSRDLVGRYTHGKWSDQAKHSSGRRIVARVAEARLKGAPHDNPFGSMRNKRTVWEIPTFAYKGAHFATFPERLAQDCIKAGSREHLIVLDPFCGSGTVPVVAKRFKRRYLGIELNRAYADMATRRIDAEDSALIAE